ncbi:RodZ domain-containing protein [Leucothrix mucor]|uniref:RodZ domain-containing protein n=1 Tax=Leucothrix mucor TaxID=45248 RepID=UPI0003B60408|nr:RodZ domain-containing protein [Leucothrix mucor]
MAVEQSIDAAADTAEVKPGDLTTIFRQHREEHGLNVNQVAEALCLSPKIITALEAEKFDMLPEPPYVRGYLRSFAKFIEIDATEMVNAYEKLRGANPNELDYRFTTSPASTARKRKGASAGIMKFGFLIVLLGLLAILSMIPGVRDWAGNTWNSFSEKSDPNSALTNNSDNPLLTGNIPAPLPIDDSEEDTESEAPGSTETADADGTTTEAGTETAAANTGFPGVGNGPVSADTPADTAEADTTEETDAADSAEETETADATDAAVDVPEGSSQLKLSFNDEVWMRIRDSSNKTLFESLSQKGDAKELVLAKPLTVRVGNAQQLEITVDGKPFDMTPFIRGSVANFTIE